MRDHQNPISWDDHRTWESRNGPQKGQCCFKLASPPNETGPTTFFGPHQLLPVIHQRFCRDCPTPTLPHRCCPLEMDFWPRSGLQVIKTCNYFSSNTNYARWRTTIPSWNWCFRLRHWGSSIPKDFWQCLASCGIYSRLMSPAEWNYQIYDKEMLAVWEALLEWRQYLLSALTPTEVWSDHLNLTYYWKPQNLSKRCGGPTIFIQETHIPAT